MLMVNIKNFKAGSQIKLNFLIWIESKYLPCTFREGDACRVGSSKCLGKVNDYLVCLLLMKGNGVLLAPTDPI